MEKDGVQHENSLEGIKLMSTMLMPFWATFITNQTPTYWQTMNERKNLSFQFYVVTTLCLSG